ncbi:MAG: outer membrane beta-barrel protein [Bacteroidales bacterium]|nr:outer membrane beta-barrel protein [Bacteroidales bacterium]
MADNKWNDKLRKQMSEYTQTPPDGLWDLIEDKVRKPAVVFPWWWALAGACAALLALLLIVRPEQPIEVTSGPVVAEATDTVETAPAPPEQTEKQLLEVPSVLTVDSHAAPVSFRRVRTLVAEDHESAAEQPQPAGQRTSSEEKLPAVKETPSDQPLPSEAERPSEQKPDQAPSEPEHVVPLQRIPAPSPLLADASASRMRLTLMASGAPGGGVSNTESGYGMPAGMRLASPSRLLSRNRSTVTETDYSMLYRVGLLANVKLARHWSIETGVQLSRLKSEVVSKSGTMSTQTSNDQYYLGVPLLAVYTPWEGRNLSVYLSAGPMAEYGIKLSGSVREVIGGNVNMNNIESSSPGDWIWSLGANAGVQLQLGRLGAIFAQPGVSWHMPGQEVQESYYTANPVAFNLAFGFRLLF